MSITHQTNSLLNALQSKQMPSYPIFLFDFLQKIDFDFSQKSINHLNHFLQQLHKKSLTTEKILSQQGGDSLLLAMAVYLGECLAKRTGEQIIWYDYAQATAEIDKQNQLHSTHFELPKQFENSLLAKIGEVYCQPLMIIHQSLLGNNVLLPFLAEMQYTIFNKAQVNINDEPNQVAQAYLHKVKTGKLLDSTIGFFAELQTVDFDFSQNSLEQIDTALQNIKQKYQFSSNMYADFIQNPAYQHFCYLLGFYIGMTASRLSNIAVKWTDFKAMYDMLDGEFDNCLEHRFILLMENHYRTPMLVITNHLFDIAPNFIRSAVVFANILHEQNASDLTIFAEPFEPNHVEHFPKTWQQSIAPLTKMLHDKLEQIVHKDLWLPTVFYLNKDAQTGKFQPIFQAINNMNIDQAIDNLYEDMDFYQKSSPIVLGCYPMFANLPTGRQPAITIEVRLSDLALQLIWAYRMPDFAVLPMVSNQANLTDDVKNWVNALCQNLAKQKIGEEHLSDFWLNKFDNHASTPHNDKKKRQNIDDITLNVLPMGDDIVKIDEHIGIGVNVVTPSFDYAKLNWQGFDLPKYVLDMSEQQRSYLQALAPNRLLNDELFSQAHAMMHLYRFGKVVWGAVVSADEKLYQPTTEVIDFDNFLIAEIVYDPTGQTDVKTLHHLANNLQKLQNLDTSQLPADQAFVSLHLQDGRSRLFAHPYPPSLATTPCVISSTWVWRRHLPNAMLSDSLVPIVIDAKTDSPHTGRVMVLPSRFWQLKQTDNQSFYQHWLAKSLKAFGENYDLMPNILAQEQQGDFFAQAQFAKVQAQIYPKFKISAKTTHIATQNPQSIKTTAQPTAQNIDNVNKNVLKNEANFVKNSVQNQVVTPPSQNPPTEKPTALIADLQQQLLAEQARLQSELSTTDHDKERKLYIIAGVVLVVVILAIILAKVMGQ